MAPFTLPSGLNVETREPTYGEEVQIILEGMKDNETFHYAKFAAITPGISRAEIDALSRPDGRALAEEVNRIWNGRPEEKEIPFEKPSHRGLAVANRV